MTNPAGMTYTALDPDEANFTTVDYEAIERHILDGSGFDYNAMDDVYNIRDNHLTRLENTQPSTAGLNMNVGSPKRAMNRKERRAHLKAQGAFKHRR